MATNSASQANKMPPCTAHHRSPHPAPAQRAERDSPNWRCHLPRQWREMAIAPLDFTVHRDYEIAASRCLGYDIDGQVCYYAHGYALNEARSDDDEEFYEVVAYSETVHAWRLRDDRWLIHRIVHHCGEGRPGPGFYSFAEQCPR